MKLFVSLFLIAITSEFLVKGKPRTKQCGIADINPMTIPKIIGGSNLTVEYPWYVAFAKPKPKTGSEWLVFCGGSLVTDRHVITAAHCYADMRRPGEVMEKRFDLLFGLKNQCGLGGDIEQVRKVYLNPNYVPDLPDAVSDVAVVALYRPVSFTPICLATRASYVRQQAVVIGFGAMSPRRRPPIGRKYPKPKFPKIYRQLGNPTTYPCYAKQATVRIMSREECLETTTYGHDLPASTICAGVPEGGSDACDGDSGGPLMTVVDGRLELVGVISYGTGCGRKHSPGVYSDVTSKGFLPWIKKIIKYDKANSVAGFPLLPMPRPQGRPLPGDFNSGIVQFYPDESPPGDPGLGGPPPPLGGPMPGGPPPFLDGPSPGDPPPMLGGPPLDGPPPFPGGPMPNGPPPSLGGPMPGGPPPFLDGPNPEDYPPVPGGSPPPGKPSPDLPSSGLPPPGLPAGLPPLPDVKPPKPKRPKKKPSGQTSIALAAVNTPKETIVDLLNSLKKSRSMEKNTNYNQGLNKNRFQRSS